MLSVVSMSDRVGLILRDAFAQRRCFGSDRTFSLMSEIRNVPEKPK